MANEPIHRWYSSVMGFSPHLVTTLIDEMGCDSSGFLLDPFCGTGTTLVESNLRGINTIGVDANPFSVFCSKVKTSYVNPKKLLTDFENFIDQDFEEGFSLKDLEYLPLTVKNGWVSSYVWEKSRRYYDRASEIPNPRIRNMVKLAILSAVKENLANIAFGPEIYKRKKKNNISIIKAFSNKIEQMSEDLNAYSNYKDRPNSHVYFGDSRDLLSVIGKGFEKKIKWVISSPPYPTEHDYSRISRIELELGGFIKSQEDLRSIKRLQIRSNSKTVYSDDRDSDHVKNVKSVADIVRKIETRSRKISHSFAKKYPYVVSNYFGGLYLHLASLAELMPSGGKCAYVLGEQRSYLGVFIPTSDIFNELACKKLKAFKLKKRIVVRVRKGTSGRIGKIKEEALILERK